MANYSENIVGHDGGNNKVNDICTSSVCTRADWSMRDLSMFNEAMSFTMTAQRKPCMQC